MRQWHSAYKKLYIWLFAAVAATALCTLLRPVRPVMNTLSRYVTTPLKTALAHVCALTSVSLAEVFILSSVAAAIFALAQLARRLVRERHRWRTVYRFFLSALCVAVTVAAAMNLLWGVNYHTDSFRQRAGITARQGTAAELAALTAYFAAGVNQTADEVPRDENGVFAADRQDILDRAAAVYAGGWDAFPALRMEPLRPKAFLCSRALTAMDFTGFYFPFTGEANLNMDSPACFLPATAIHEMAHQCQIASEQECNFVAIAVSIQSDDPLYRYSGWLMGYLHTANALYQVDKEAWRQLRNTLNAGALADIAYNNAYWAAAHTAFTDASQTVYDSFIKSSGDPNGVQSYGMVVDLLLAYYG